MPEKITPADVQEYTHERDDLLDDLAKLDEGVIKGYIEQITIQHQRVLKHLRRIEELGRLAKLLEDDQVKEDT